MGSASPTHSEPFISMRVGGDLGHCKQAAQQAVTSPVWGLRELKKRERHHRDSRIADRARGNPHTSTGENSTIPAADLRRLQLMLSDCWSFLHAWPTQAAHSFLLCLVTKAAPPPQPQQQQASSVVVTLALVSGQCEEHLGSGQLQILLFPVGHGGERHNGVGRSVRERVLQERIAVSGIGSKCSGCPPPAIGTLALWG